MLVWAHVVQTGVTLKTMILSVVIPILNEAENLATLAEKITQALDKTPHIAADAWEVWLVNDGSTDTSADVIASIHKQDQRFKGLHFRKNQGQTAAMDAGIRNAKGTFILTMDADLQNDPADVPSLFKAMKAGVGAVCGVRVNRQDTWLRRISSHLANRVRNKLSGETITDTGCSLKLFRRECFDHIKLFEGLHRFLPTLIKMEGYDVVEIPVQHHPRLAGNSKYGVWNRLFKSFRDLLAVRWMKSRMLRYELLPNSQDTSPQKTAPIQAPIAYASSQDMRLATEVEK